MTLTMMPPAGQQKMRDMMEETLQSINRVMDDMTHIMWNVAERQYTATFSEAIEFLETWLPAFYYALAQLSSVFNDTDMKCRIFCTMFRICCILEFCETDKAL